MLDSVPPGQRAGWWVLALPVGCLLALVASIWLDLEASVDAPGRDLVGGDSWPWTLNGLVLGALAGVVLWHDRRSRFGWALGALGVFWALDGVAQGYLLAGVEADGSWPGSTAVFWFWGRFGALLPMVLAVLLLTFPHGRFLPGRWRAVSWGCVAAMAVAFVAVVLAPMGGAVPDDLPPDIDPDVLTIDALRGATAWPTALTVVALLATVATVVVRHRRSTGVDRDRMRWLLWSVLVMALAIVAGAFYDGPGAGLILTFLVMVLPGAAMTVAVVNPQLVSIQDLLLRTIVYGGLAVIVLAVDLAAVALLSAALDGLEQSQVVAVVLLLSVLLYGPLRLRLWSLGRRLVLGTRDDPYDVMAGLASTLETEDDGPAQLTAVAGAVARAFGVSFVRVEVDRVGGERLVATHGTAPDAVRSLPITYRDREVGRLVLPARGVRSRLTARDERLLGDLVRQAAAAARTSRLAEELQGSRERLVTAREEERRRIRRDLHDGLGPALGGVVFQLESAGLLVERDPAAARRQIAATSGLVQEVVADVRRLVHDLRPPALDDRGLVGALRQLAERMRDVEVDIVGDDLEGLPAAVEVAAYRIVAEALNNVARHARASRCSVRLAADERELVVEVTDNGVGIAEYAEVGVGLLSLRERADELGGRSEIQRPPHGGTVVRTWLPMARTQEEEPA